MDVKTFPKPNGKFLKNTDHNLTFLPNALPPLIEYEGEFVSLIADANLKLGQLSAIANILPNPKLLMRPYLNREAVLSSKIEGTQASEDDLFRYQAVGDIEKKTSARLRIYEVVNYVNAFEKSLDGIKRNKKIDLVLVKNSHAILMKGVRGGDKHPGEFRTIQNWIGSLGSEIEDARYVPPPAEYVKDMISNTLQFIQNTPKQIPLLVQCAMLHYQFEAIHPFADGNGRIGRLLISLFLTIKGVLSHPLLYLSAYFEKNRRQYWDKLLQVSQNSEWKEWIRFFLQAIIHQSEEATTNIQNLLALRTKYQDSLRQKHKTSAFVLVDRLFSNPYITITNAKEHLGSSFPAAQRAIEVLIDLQILNKAPFKVGRNRIFVAPEIIKIVG
jgi:Fic family protein